jgi:hypothetical protein
MIQNQETLIKGSSILVFIVRSITFLEVGIILIFIVAGLCQVCVNLK